MWKEHPGNTLSQAGGELSESEILWASSFIGVRVQYTIKGPKAISLNVIRT